MKKKREVLPALAERLELPEEALSGAAKLTVTADRRALIENHRGILELGESCIVVSTAGEPIRIIGDGMNLRAMNCRELLIEGMIRQVEWG